MPCVNITMYNTIHIILSNNLYIKQIIQSEWVQYRKCIWQIAINNTYNNYKIIYFFDLDLDIVTPVSHILITHMYIQTDTQTCTLKYTNYFKSQFNLVFDGTLVFGWSHRQVPSAQVLQVQNCTCRTEFPIPDIHI